MKKIIVFLLIFFSLSSLVMSAEEIITVEAVGLGDIVNGKKEIARAKAVESALRVAIEKAIGTLISQESMIRNGLLIDDNVFKKSEGFIKGYKIIDETVDSKEDLYWVTIEAEVMMAEVEQSLKDIMESIGTINVFVLIEGEEEFTHLIINDLIENGIEVIDPEQLKSNDEMTKLAMIQDGSENLDALSFWFGTQYILRGELKTIRTSKTLAGATINYVSLESYLELLDVVTGEKIEMFFNPTKSRKFYSRKDIQYLISDLFNELKGEIPKAFLKAKQDKESLKFVVIGIPYFEQRLEEIPGISSLENFQARGERVDYRLRYDGNLNTLLNRLKELGYSVERQNNEYYIRTISTEFKVTIANCSFMDTKSLKNTFSEIQGLSFLNKTITFSLEGDITSAADKLYEMGYEITGMTNIDITAQKGE